MATVFRLTCILVSLGCLHSATITSEFEKTLTSYVDATMKCRNVPGLTLAVVNGDDEWLHGFGTANLDSGKMVTPTTHFNIGSITKSFTMTLLAKLLKKHGHTWETKVVDILGKDFHFVDDIRTNQTTLRDILSHRTGLARWDITWLAGIPASVTRGNMCSRLKYLPEQLPFRDEFLYNNYMFMLAGHVSEVLENASWEDLVTSEILQPIGMTSTRLLWQPSDVLRDDMARPYLLQDEGFINGTTEIYTLHPLEPAGAILSTATDMAKWVKFNLNKGKTADGTQLVDKKFFLDSVNAHTPLPDSGMYRPKFPVDNTLVGYGYGWNVASYRGYRQHSHGGGLFSYISLLWWYPDMNVGIFASTNGPGARKGAVQALTSIFYYVSDHLLGEPQWLNETTSCSFPEPWQNTENNASVPQKDADNVNYTSFQEFRGVYMSPFAPDIMISSNETHLQLSMNRVTGILHATPTSDSFEFELTRPLEFVDVNNTQQIKVNFTRQSSSGPIESLAVDMREAPMSFRKEGLSYVAVYPNTASTPSPVAAIYMLLLTLLILCCE